MFKAYYLVYQVRNSMNIVVAEFYNKLSADKLMVEYLIRGYSSSISAKFVPGVPLRLEKVEGSKQFAISMAKSEYESDPAYAQMAELFI